MIHVGKYSSSTIISKGISAGHSQNTYRGMVKILKNAGHVKNYSQCDSLILGSNAGGHTFPYISSSNKFVQIEHEASTSKVSEEKCFTVSKEDYQKMMQ